MKAPLNLNKLILTMALVAYGFFSTAQDVGVISVITPVDGSSLFMGCSYPVTVRIQNFDTTVIQNIAVKYAIGFNNSLLETATASIAAGGTIDYTFTDSLVISNTGVGSGFAQTELIGDVAPGNDQVTTFYLFNATSCAVGIEENLELSTGKITLFPNPVSNNLSIDYEGQEKVNIDIYSIAGTLIRSLGSLSNADLKDIHVADLESGVYMIQISSDKGSAYKKFVK